MQIVKFNTDICYTHAIEDNGNKVADVFHDRIAMEWVAILPIPNEIKRTSMRANTQGALLAAVETRFHVMGV